MSKHFGRLLTATFILIALDVGLFLPAAHAGPSAPSQLCIVVGPGELIPGQDFTVTVDVTVDQRLDGQREPVDYRLDAGEQSGRRQSENSEPQWP